MLNEGHQNSGNHSEHHSNAHHTEGHSAHHAGGASSSGSTGSSMKFPAFPKIDFKGVNGKSFVDGIKDMVGIWKGDVAAIKKVADKNEGLGLALIYIVLAAFASPLGLAIFGVSAFGITVRLEIVSALIQGVISSVLSVLGIYFTHFVATNFFQGKADFTGFFRVMGYASFIGVLAIITPLSFLMIFVGLLMLYVWFKILSTLEQLTTQNIVLTLVILVIAALLVGYIMGSLGLGYNPGYSFSSTTFKMNY